MRQILSTQRLILREMCAADAAFMLRLMNEPAWLEYIGDRGVRTEAAARDYIEQGPVKSYRENGFGLYLTQLLDNTPIGICGLIRREGLDGVDLGYGLVEEFWSQGYAYEAASATLKYAENTLNLIRILAICSVENTPSISLLEKMQFHFESMLTLPADDEAVMLFAREK